MVGKIIVIGKKERMVLEERENERECKSGEIDDEKRIEKVVSVVERIGEKKKELRIGIDELDGMKGNGGEDI